MLTIFVVHSAFRAESDCFVYFIFAAAGYIDVGALGDAKLNSHKSYTTPCSSYEYIVTCFDATIYNRRSLKVKRATLPLREKSYLQAVRPPKGHAAACSSSK